MKNTLTWLLAIAPIFSLAQGVKANLYDKFLKKQRVETDAISMTGLADKTGCRWRLQPLIKRCT
jgi:hypothetical protein